MPAMSASSEPRLAIAAPARTTGTDHAAPAARTAESIGAWLAAITAGPAAASAATPITR
jgi:hypothetical protein